MGRTVVGDEKQIEAQVDTIFRTGCSVQVGLLVGKLGNDGSRDMVFSLVPTPKRDGEEAAQLSTSSSQAAPAQGSSKKASKAKPQADSAPMHILTEWIGEHARQVERMLVGGMRVVGIYAFCSEGTFRSSSSILWQAVTAVADSTTSSLDAGEGLDSVLLHISSSPRRIVCRSCSRGLSFSATALQPCEWKLGKLLTNLQEFSCTYNVNIRYPIQLDDSDRASSGLGKEFSSAIAYEAERLGAAFAIVDGTVPEADKPLSSGNTLHSVELLLPFDGSARVQKPRSGAKMLGEVVYTGEVRARAYGVVREPISRAITDLKGDIVASLKSRLDLLVDEAEQAQEEMKGRTDSEDAAQTSTSDTILIRQISSVIPEHSFLLPRRVFVPWLEGIMISDYMLPNESFEDVQERCVALFGVDHGQKSEPPVIIESELPGIVPSRDAAHPAVSRSKGIAALGKSVVGAKSRVNLIFVGAALAVLLVALLLAAALRSRST